MGRGDRGMKNKIWNAVPEKNLVMHIKKKEYFITMRIFLKGSISTF